MPKYPSAFLLGQVLFVGAAFGGCADSSKVAGGSTDGAKIFQSACARCHGKEGIPSQASVNRTGVRPLNSGRVQQMSDEDLKQRILRGSANRAMPAFQGALSDDQLAALVIHVRGLSEKKTEGDTPKKAEPEVAPKKGEQVAPEKGAAEQPKQVAPEKGAAEQTAP